MKRSPLWLIAVIALAVMACQFTNPLAASAPTEAPVTEAGPSIPTVLPTPLIEAPTLSPAPTATLAPTAGCAAWFFTFRPGLNQGGCADPVVMVQAVGEDFVGGRVYRSGASPDDPTQKDTIFVIYNNGTWETYPDDFQQGDPDTDPSMVPPANRVQPAGAIGKMWREHSAVRSALGWAYGPELPFTGRYQNPQGDTHNIYVDHGKGLVLKLTTVDQGPRTWKVVGDY